MAYYLVRDDGGSNIGTATGDGGRVTSKPTGAWPASTSAYYAKWLDARAATTPPTWGDTILYANDHDEVFELTSNSGLGPTSSSFTNWFRHISVDPTDVEEYLPGASITNSDSLFNYSVYGLMLFAGVNIINNGQNDCLVGTDEGFIRFIDSLLHCDHTNTAQSVLRNFGSSTWQATYELINCEVKHNATGGGDLVRLQNGSVLKMFGGKLTHGTGIAEVVSLLCPSGSRYELTGVDMTNVKNPFDPSVDNTVYVLQGCTLNPNLTVNAPQNRQNRYELYECDDTTGNAQHRFLIQDGAGKAVNNDSTYVTNTDAFYDGSSKSSIEVTTTALCDSAQPFVFELPAQIVDLSQAASDTVSIELVTDNITLTDADICASLMYPDGTNKTVQNFASSLSSVPTGSTGVNNPYTVGTTLTTGSLGASDWTGEPATPNFYKLSMDTSGDTGSLAAVAVRIEVNKPSLASGDLFIHPLITVS